MWLIFEFKLEDLPTTMTWTNLINWICFFLIMGKCAVLSVATLNVRLKIHLCRHVESLFWWKVTVLITSITSIFCCFLFCLIQSKEIVFLDCWTETFMLKFHKLESHVSSLIPQICWCPAKLSDYFIMSSNCFST